VEAGGKAFRDWTINHDKVITIIAAFFIFCTFLARDKKKEEYKDLVSEIHSARTTFDIRNEHSYPTSLLMEINEQVHIIRANGATRSARVPIAAKFRLRSEIQHELEDAGETYFMAMMQFDQLARLDEHLTSDSETKSQLDSHHDACIDALEKKEDVNKDFEALVAHEDEQKPLSEDDAAALTFAAVNEKALDLQQQSAKEMEFYASIFPHVVDELEREEKTGNKRLNIYSWLSFWVFAAGWALTLSAKLTGIKFGGGE
jgi:hypothetical protein